jgi:hypothetical protein
MRATWRLGMRLSNDVHGNVQGRIEDLVVESRRLKSQKLNTPACRYPMVSDGAGVNPNDTGMQIGLQGFFDFSTVDLGP